jgi:hypothetical protein
VILTDYRVDVRANRDGGLSPVHSYSSYGEAHGGASQHPRRRLWVLRKHPLLRALAPLSRRRARPPQWLRLRVSSWVLLSILSLLLRHTKRLCEASCSDLFLWRARKRDGTSPQVSRRAPLLVQVTTHGLVTKISGMDRFGIYASMLEEAGKLAERGGGRVDLARKVMDILDSFRGLVLQVVCPAKSRIRDLTPSAAGAKPRCAAWTVAES